MEVPYYITGVLILAQFFIKHNFDLVTSSVIRLNKPFLLGSILFAHKMKNLTIGKPMFDTLAGHH